MRVARTEIVALSSTQEIKGINGLNAEQNTGFSF